MSQFKTKTFIVLGLCGTLGAAVPLTSSAQRTDSAQWNRGQAELQKQLPPEMAPDSYPEKLKQLGYKITSINYNNPDYLEYEVVKGDQTWEVQIDVDEDTGKATQIDIAQNMWKTDATTAALQENLSRTAATDTGVASDNPTATRRTMNMRNNQYSDRDRSTTDQLVRELDTLPVGHNKEFYKKLLRQRGYEITKLNKDDSDEMNVEAVKDGHSVQLDISFDENTAQSTEIDASTLWAESESTTRTREAPERTLDSRIPSDRTRDMNRDDDRHTDAGTRTFTDES